MYSELPEGYFEKLGGRIHKRIDRLEDDIEIHAPLLSSIDTEGMYILPPYYFAGLPQSVSSRVYKRKVRYLSLWRIGTAAALVFLAGFFLNNWNTEVSAGNEQLAAHEIIDYYIDNADELELEMLREGYGDDDIESGLFSNIETDDIEAYISAVIDEVELVDIAELESTNI